jgi:DUF1680 family protein
VYGTGGGTIWVQLLETSRAVFSGPDGDIALRQETEYPERGKATFRVETGKPQELTLAVRIPEQAFHVSASLNETPIEHVTEPGTYLTVSREWHSGDTLDLVFEIEMHVDTLDDGNKVISHGVEVLSADRRDNSEGFGEMRVVEPLELRAAERSADGRARYEITAKANGQMTPLILTPFADSGNATVGTRLSQSGYRTAFPSVD